MMHTRTRARSFAVTSLGLAALAAVAACRTAPGGTPAPTATHAQGDAAAIERARLDSMRLPWTAADAEFMRHMIAHHSQAIVMARMAPARTETQSIRTLAERIINAQRDEIVTMQRWLRDRRQPVPEPDTASMGATMGSTMGAGAHTGHDAHAGMHHGTAGSSGGTGAAPAPDHAAGHAGMPGMLTPAQLGQLAAARGVEFDRLFLTFMIQHHRGATEMVSKLFSTYGAGQDEATFKLASDVNVDQKTEIARMQRMLAALELVGGSP